MSNACECDRSQGAWDKLERADLRAPWAHPDPSSGPSHKASRHRESELRNSFFASFTNSDPDFNISFYKIHANNTGADEAGRNRSVALLQARVLRQGPNLPADARTRLPQEVVGPRLI